MDTRSRNDDTSFGIDTPAPVVLQAKNNLVARKFKSVFEGNSNLTILPLF
jgi:hypothetical protein